MAGFTRKRRTFRSRSACSARRWIISTFLHRKAPLRDEHGTIVKWFGSSIDIEDRKRAENSPPLEAQLQATFNVIPAYTWYALPSGALIFVNERTADYLGKLPYAYKGSPSKPFNHLDLASEYPQIVAAIEELKPTILIGVSTVGKLFSREVVEAMSRIIVAVKIEPISANERCTRLWKSEIQFDGIFEGLGVLAEKMC